MSQTTAQAVHGASGDVRFGRTESSMVWAAWADALGFISELTDENGLRRRTGGDQLSAPIAWTRRVGGKFGVAAEMPAGCYSDDTQLRLATSRAISGHGFDVEAFARIELTVWPAYALGGGRASRAAATAMTKVNASWSTNFYPGWTEAGGNGAAMRVQPHVWAAANLMEDDFLVDVVRNSVVTHGHPRALVGAVLQSVALAQALHRGRVPGVNDWSDLIGRTRVAHRSFFRDEQLSSFWAPQWERQTGLSLELEWQKAVDECEAMLRDSETAVEAMNAANEADDLDRVSAAYRQLADRLRLHDPKTRGSGTATVVAALALAAALPDHPAKSSIVAARAVGTDTDTIATMAASIVGASDSFSLPKDVQDLDYLRAEADRLYRIAQHMSAPMFSYVDTLRWSPPQSQLDAVGIADGRPALGGMGWLEFTSAPYGEKEGVWSWAQTSFGPSIIVKHRQSLKPLSNANWPVARAMKTGVSRTEAQPERSQQRTPRGSRPNRQPTLFEATDAASTAELVTNPRTQPEPSATSVRGSGPIDVDQILAWLGRQKFNDESLGYAVRRISEAGSLEQMALFLASVRSEIRQIK